MKLIVVNKLLVNRGWQLTTRASRFHRWISDKALPGEHLVILPAKSSTALPVGTVETIMRRINQAQPTTCWSRALSGVRSLELVVEKAGDVLWGRVAIKGLFLVVWGNDTYCLTTQVQEILTGLMAESADHSDWSACTLAFDIRYDMTEVWSFLREIRVSYLADLAGIEPATINRFVSGKEFPSTEQMVQLQKSLQEMGHHLLRLSS